MAKILIVEDDKELNESVGLGLIAGGYEIASAYDGEQALKMFEEHNFDLILSDIMMPNIDGFSMLEKIRNGGSNIPVIFMTARDDKFSKQLGYRLGVDDYIVKPFDLDELILKIGAMFRRTNILSSQKLEVGNLVLDKQEHMAYIDGEELPLTVREFDLLFKFLSYPKKTFTRSALMEEFWDYDSSATSRTVDVYMAKLRDKTSKCSGFEIVTVHGLGYKAVINEKK